MPVFDEWGIVPAGHRGPRPNPLAAEPEGMDVPPEQEEAEEAEEASEGEEASSEDEASRGASSAGEDEASTGAKPVGEDGAAMGANPSRGSVSSSRGLPAGVDLQVLSSSDEEGAFYVARSSRVEEEKEMSGGGEGRSEPRSKAVHDRSAVTARNASREEARAHPEEAGASNTQPPRVKKRVWVLPDE